MSSDVKIYKKNGEVFKDRKSGFAELTRRKLSLEDWGVIPEGEGFVAVNLLEMQKLAEEAEEAKEALKISEQKLKANASKARQVNLDDQEDSGFWEVSLTPKLGPDDPERVPIGLNGDIITVKRGTRVILPVEYLKILDQAVSNDWKFEEGEEPVIVGQIRKFTYQTYRKDCTEQEYNDYRKKNFETAKSKKQ